MKTAASTIVLAVTAVMLPASAPAAAPVVQPVQVGAKTVRYEQGVPTVDLKRDHGAVQLRPLPLDHGGVAFSVAVFNGGDRPVNIDIANFTVTAGGQTLAVLSVDELVRKAKNRAIWGQIGLALGAAAAAGQRDTYTGTLYTPPGTYRSFYSAPSAMGQVQAAVRRAPPMALLPSRTSWTAGVRHWATTSSRCRPSIRARATSARSWCGRSRMRNCRSG